MKGSEKRVHREIFFSFDCSSQVSRALKIVKFLITWFVYLTIYKIMGKKYSLSNS